MKTTYKIFSVLLLSVLLSNCNEEYDVASVNGTPMESVSFPKGIQAVDVDPAAPTYKLAVDVLKKSSADRTFNVVVIPLSEVPATYNAVSTGMVEADAADYSLATTTVTIPAGETRGYIDVNFTAGNLADGLVKSFAVKLTVPEDAQPISKKDIVVVSFTKKCEGTKANLTINFDNYASETSWELYFGSDLIGSGGPFEDGDKITSADFCLTPGSYTFVLYDSYGDGICCASGNGNYSIKAGADVIISGAPTGAQEVKEFTIE